MKSRDIRTELTGKGLRVTPQRVAILEAVIKLNNHPTADNILECIKDSHPNIASGTVYKVLETLVLHGLIKKVKTDTDVMRYDAILERHHHLYASESDRIEDYFDANLNDILADYFKSHKIPGFEIKDIKLQIIGRFKKGQPSKNYHQKK